MRHVVTYDWILVSLHAVCGCAWRDIDGDEPAASVTKRARALQYVMTRVPSVRILCRCVFLDSVH